METTYTFEVVGVLLEKLLLSLWVSSRCRGNPCWRSRLIFGRWFSCSWSCDKIHVDACWWSQDDRSTSVDYMEWIRIGVIIVCQVEHTNSTRLCFMASKLKAVIAVVDGLRPRGVPTESQGAERHSCLNVLTGITFPSAPVSTLQWIMSGFACSPVFTCSSSVACLFSILPLTTIVSKNS